MIQRVPDKEDGPGLHARLWMISATVISIVVTVWLCTLGPVPAVLAIVVEKHVLVAILVMRLDVERPSERPPQASASAS